VDLPDYALTIRIAHTASPDYQFIADYSMHRVIPLYVASM
jgi:hypothetical protein